ncbi:hypothetical protein M2347_002791 [Chryseobacterium sp. H1D6B]|uniref:fibronectin type III domain-containing protein n=1 Tax=Chryseobacterium sp. H1D6B TaxID=2940588 RepID=UPI0015CDDED2|nr:fibronectin type III domain-containing protein [Chryseobacterium sp. H1D6B]MDH6253064.1 hypothetical protein [Chryseobacterium sp. H1D6B]
MTKNYTRLGDRKYSVLNPEKAIEVGSDPDSYGKNKTSWFTGLMMIVALFFAGGNSFAQTNIANYTFSKSSGTYTPITGGTVFISGTYDNSVSPAITMGGTFPFGGANMTTCYISTNGFITFGAAPSTSSYTPLSSLGSTTGAIAAFAQDGGTAATSTTSEIRYQDLGTEFVVQFTDHANYYNSATEKLNFQIRLNYATGAVTIVYGNCTDPGTSTSGSAVQVGIRGNSVTYATNVNNLYVGNVPASTTCDWSNAVTGYSNSSSMLFSSTTNVNVKIPTGLTYTWTPGTQLPVRTFTAPTAVTNTGATLAWTAPTGATSYNVQYRVPGTCAWTNWSGNPVATNSVTFTGLNQATSYQVRVQAVNGAAQSIYSHTPSSSGTGDGYAATGTFTTLANCASVVTALTSSAVALNSATIGWTAPTAAPANGYEYYYSTSSTAPTGSTAASGAVAAGVVSANLTGLTSATPYYFWVRTNCNGTDKGAWVGSSSFTTACSVTNVPYTLDFTNVTTPALPPCTSAVNDGTGNVWNTYSLNTSGFTGNVLNYSYNSTNAANTWFFTQGITLTAGTSYRIKYKYGNASGTTYPEKLKVAYGTSAASSSMTNVLADYPAVNNATANSVSVDFIPSVSGVYYFGFQAYSAANMNRLYVDDINVDVTPTCLEPSAVTVSNIATTTAGVSWTAPSSVPGNGYEYYYSTTNTAPTSSTVASGVSNGTTVSVSGLSPATTYYIWVRSVCSSTDKSIWSTSATFITACNTVASFNENFDSTTIISAGNLPTCWTSIGTNSTYARVYASTAISGPNALYIYNDGTATGMASTPEISTLQTGNYILKFKGRANFTAGGIVQIGYLTNPADTSTFVMLGSYTASSVTAVDDYSLSITGVPAGVNKLVFKHTGVPANSILIDDMSYQLNPALATSEVSGIKNNIKAYPNPFGDVLNISDISNVRSVFVTDIAGRLVKTIDNPASALQLGDLKSGLYLVTLNMKDGSKQTIKAIKK